MYFILSNELEKPKFDAHIEGALLNYKGELIPSIFGKGKSVKNITDKNYSIKVNPDYSEPGKLRDRLSVYVHHSVHLLVVSEEVQQLINEEAPNQVEFYSLLIENKNEIISDYKIANVLYKIDCINYEESELEFERYDENEVGEGSIYTIDRLILDKFHIPPHLKIFLLGRLDDSTIVVHGRLKTMIQERGISGFVFCNSEDFQF